MKRKLRKWRKIYTCWKIRGRSWRRRKLGWRSWGGWRRGDGRKWRERARRGRVRGRVNMRERRIRKYQILNTSMRKYKWSLFF